MSPLRTRFVEDMQLHGYTARTQVVYASAIRGLARYYRKSPDLVSEEELRRYFLHLRLERRVARPTATIALCALKFFFENTLQRAWTSLKLLRPPRERKLPVVLSRQEVQQILSSVDLPIYRVCLTTIYSCGLRLNEGRCLQVSQIDSQRMLLRIRGKANKDRYVPLPKNTLAQLRQLWRTHRSPLWLFPSRARTGLPSPASEDQEPISDNALQGAFDRALRRSLVGKDAHIHTLRHSYATPLLEAGVNLRIIQSILGHATPVTTAIYTHLTQQVQESVKAPIEELMQGL